MWITSPYSGGGGFAFRTRNGDAGTINPWRYPAIYGVNANGGGDLYATRYYDQNNTGYYVDPSTISYLSSLRISDASSGASLIVGTNDTSRVYSDDPRKQLAINADYYPCLYVNALSNNGNTTHGAVISMSGNLNSGGYRRWGMGIANTNPGIFSIGYADNNSNPHYGVGGSGWSQFWIGTGGDVYATDSFRSPIFYDSNNTGYYVDPASTSNCNVVNTAGYSNANYGYRIFRNIGSLASWQEGYHQLTLVNSDAGYVTLNFHRAGYTSNNIYYDGALHTDTWMDSSSSFRAPIFYDSNNTGYYIDPASTSNLYDLTLTGGKHTYLYINPGNGYEAMVRYNGGSGNTWYAGKRTTGTVQAGTDGFHFYSDAGGDTVVGFGTDGTIKAKGDVYAYSSSDRQLKDNITPIENALEKVKQIGGYTFDWNNKQTIYEGHDVGVVAQEIEAVLPEVVTTRDTGFKAVKYEKIVPLLIEAIKEQQTQIEELKQLVNTLINK
jgi:hypothetical protein